MPCVHLNCGLLSHPGQLLYNEIKENVFVHNAICVQWVVICVHVSSVSRRYVLIVMCALAPGKLTVAPVLFYAETKHLR